MYQDHNCWSVESWLLRTVYSSTGRELISIIILDCEDNIPSVTITISTIKLKLVRWVPALCVALSLSVTHRIYYYQCTALVAQLGIHLRSALMLSELDKPNRRPLRL